MKILKSFFLILILISFANARSIEQIQESGEIIIAIYEDFPPYSYVENGEPKGIDIDLGKKIASSLGVKPKWYFTGSDENLDDDLRNVIWKGNLIHKTRADVMLRIPYDYDYLRRVDLSTGELQTDLVVIKGPYQAEKWVIIAHKDKIPEINSLAIFAYHKIGVEIDTLPDKYLSSLNRGLLGKNIGHYFKMDKMIQDFKDKKIDAIAGLKSQLEYFFDYNKNKDKYIMTDEIIGIKSIWDIATAVRTDYRPLSYHIDGLIDELYSNGEIKRIFEKYNVNYVKPISRK